MPLPLLKVLQHRAYAVSPEEVNCCSSEFEVSAIDMIMATRYGQRVVATKGLSRRAPHCLSANRNRALTANHTIHIKQSTMSHANLFRFAQNHAGHRIGIKAFRPTFCRSESSNCIDMGRHSSTSYNPEGFSPLKWQADVSTKASNIPSSWRTGLKLIN